mgnify:CR=1 FL=1|jgi:hypothetical protein
MNKRRKFEFETGDLVLTVADERQGMSCENKIAAIVEWYFCDVIKPADSFYQLIAGDQIIRRNRRYVWDISD